MKIVASGFCLLGFLAGCTSPAPPTEAPPVDEMQLLQQVRTQVQYVFKARQERDSSAVARLYSQAPDAVFVTDGRKMGYDDFRKTLLGSFRTLKSQQFVTLSEDSKVLGPGAVLVNWAGAVRAETQDGKKHFTDTSLITFVFQKKDSTDWNVIYTNESATVPALSEKNESIR